MRKILCQRGALTILIAASLACNLSGRPGGPPTVADPTPEVGPPAGPSAPPSPAASPGPTPDLILHNGVVVTMDGDRPRASAIGILGEKLVAIGDEAEVLSTAGPSTTVIDLEGRAVLPGFVDAHSHMFADGDPGGVQETLHRTGVTTTAELYVDEALLQSLLALEAQGGLRVRTSAYLVYNDACGTEQGNWYSAYAPTRRPGEMLRIGGVKIFADGGSCNVPAVTFEYPGGYGQGDLYFTVDQLTPVIRELDQAGWQVAIHAIGDRAIDVVLQSYIAVLNGENPRRHRIEHNAVVRPDQYPLYTQAGAVATIFGPFSTCAKLGDPTRFRYRVPDEHQEWEWPWRELIEANPSVRFAWHADMPHVFTSDVFAHLYGLVTRNQIADDGSVCEAPAWLAANALSVERALELMTVDAAYALDREAEVGSLSPGKYADLIVLSANPLEVDPAELPGLRVLLTMVGGRVEYCAEGMEALCPGPSPAQPSPLPATPGRDEFNAPTLAAEWHWVRESAAEWSLTQRPGWLRIETGNYAMLDAGGDAPVLLRSSPDGDFEIVARLDFSPKENFQFAGIVIYQDDDHFVALGRAYCGFIPPCAGDGVYLDNDELPTGGVPPSAGGLPSGAIQLRLVRQGETYTGYWSQDGQGWQEVGSTQAAFDPQQLGAFAATSGSGAPSIPAWFDWFEIKAP